MPPSSNGSGVTDDASLEEDIVRAEGALHRVVTEQRLRYLWLGVSVALGAVVVPEIWGDIWNTGLRTYFVYTAIVVASISTYLAVVQILSYRTEVATHKHSLDELLVQRKLLAATSSDGVGSARRIYRLDTSDIVDHYRKSAARNRRVHNYFQITIIVGSIVVTSLTSAALDASPYGWVAATVSALVSMSAGFIGYFKFRERSFNQQMTADAIEKELNSVQLMIWDYAGKSEEQSLTYFAERVESLKEEQRKRELQLEQSSDSRPESRYVAAAGAGEQA